ncbi:MAG: dihydroorotate dehydrogenase-like protein [Pirellulaceae bacterium]|nr:dihydroorotate dehydrogenase-like protein [Pirellulaceae bacterium]
MSAELNTTYLGLKLKNPLVVSACPLTGELDELKRIEQSGSAAAVLPSLFEEQIEHDAEQMVEAQEFGTDSFAEALTYFPRQDEYRSGPDEYLAKIEAAKKSVAIPIIASLNGTSKGGWVRYAKMMQEAGADALELNIYFVPGELDMTGSDVENRYLELVAAVKGSISIPLGVKVGPYFTSMGNMASRLVEAGADGLVLFNRFFHPDIDLENMETHPKLHLSDSTELSVPLRWIALLHGRLNASLAATSGIHDASDMLKVLAAGADVGMIASVLYAKGVGQIGNILAGMTKWLDEKEYVSVEQLKGSMSRENCPDPSAFQRGNYMKTLTSFVGKAI